MNFKKYFLYEQLNLLKFPSQKYVRQNLMFQGNSMSHRQAVLNHGKTNIYCNEKNIAGHFVQKEKKISFRSKRKKIDFLDFNAKLYQLLLFVI